MKKYLFLIIFNVICYTIVICDNKKDKGDEFMATHDWQTIKKGQKVPAGLHYRINLETGKTEAKLLDKEDQQSTNDKRDLLEIPSENTKPDLSPDEIKEALKNIKSDDVESEIKIKSKFRSYDELKAELGDLNLTSKVDAEIIKDLLQEYKKELAQDKININRLINIIEDFDYLVHHYDNGLEFVNQNGFRDIIYKNFNFSSDTIKENTLRLFGSLVQNNARVQIHALETGAIPVLLRFLSSDTSEQIKSNAIFALGCLLRRFPLAQQRFTENGGVFVILQLIEKSTLKIQLKVITLMSDLFMEKRLADKNSNQVIMSQYKLVNLEYQLMQQNWCNHLDKSLDNVVKIYPEDHDSVEKILTSIKIIVDGCKITNRKVLEDLKNKYERLASEDINDNDHFFKEMFNLCSDILYKNKKTEL